MCHTEWYNFSSWVATGKTFINRIFKPIARVIHRPLVLAKTNPKKTGIIASVGAALVAACWFGWKKIVGHRAAAVAPAPAEFEMYRGSARCTRANSAIKV